jgi:hypothetical protein
LTPEQFLRRIFGASRGYLCLARISRLNGLGFSQFFFRYPEQLSDALAWITENDTYGLDLYFGVQLLSRPIRQKEFALPTRVLWADLDECHPNKLGRYGEPKPQLVMQSSQGRWQAYWFLSRPVKAEVAQELNKQIAAAYKEDGCDQSGWDTTQIMRLPTRNWKYIEHA